MLTYDLEILHEMRRSCLIWFAELCSILDIKQALFADRPGRYSYSTLAYSAGQSYVLCEVLAEKDAHIALSEGQNVYTSEMYEIVIGANKNVYSDIR
jgi:hypothetical protein